MMLAAFLKKTIGAIAAVAAIAFIVFSYKKFWVDDKMMLALVGGIITVYLGLLKQKMEQDAMFRSLFDGFNARYCKEANDLLEKLRHDAQCSLEGEDRNLVIDYFNLCAEEFLWFKKGRIPKDVWGAWRSGMLVNLEISQVKKLFGDEMNTNLKSLS